MPGFNFRLHTPPPESPLPMSRLPSHARVVIIGGGAVGCSILWHLAQRGWKDVLLLEKSELTAGSTWHAAGNCPNFAGNWGVMRMQRYSTQLYKTLGVQADYPINYHVTGSVRLAQTQARLDEFRHVANLGRYYGIPFEVATPGDLQARYPCLETHGLTGGLWDPDDGDIDPAQLSQAFASGARALGATLVRACPVTGLTQKADSTWTVRTHEGDVQADIIVNAAGYYAPAIGAMMGRDMPSIVMEHQYMITAEIPELAARAQKLPLLRDPDDSYYLRQERNGLLLGPYEHRLARTRWTAGDMPEDFSFQLFPDDLERLESYIEKACARVPLLATAGIIKVINGPIPYAPDGLPLLGPAPGLRNAFEACAFTFGIVQAGGAGKIMADYIVEGEPEWDMWGLDPRRYTDFATRSYCEAKAIETYESEYAIGFPVEEKPAGRPAKTSPLYDRLKAQGAVFGARGGWERAVWYARDGDDRDAAPGYARGPWFARAGQECRAVQEACGILDLTGFSRFELKGAGAAAWLDGMVTGRLPKVGKVALVYFCSPKGGTLMEMTATRFAQDHFWLITAAVAQWHDRDWLEQHLPTGGSLTLTDLTTQFGTLVLAGPRSRELMAQVTRAPLDTPAFPWLAVRTIDIGMARVVALRVSYVGELGYELHVPMHNMVPVHVALVQAGAPLGLKPFGMYAMDSLRLEKSYLGWKGDITTEFTPLEAGLDRFVALDKPDFIGKAALMARHNQPTRHKLMTMTLEGTDIDAPYGSLILQAGEIVGFTTSAGYGHRTGKTIALGYVREAFAVAGAQLDVVILGVMCKATLVAGQLYDGGNAKLRG